MSVEPDGPAETASPSEGSWPQALVMLGWFGVIAVVAVVAVVVVAFALLSGAFEGLNEG